MTTLRFRPQVLALLALALPLLARVGAQPPDLATEPPQVPLLLMTPEEFEAAHGGLSRLKLKLDDVSAQQVADEVSRQLGMPIGISYRLKDSARAQPEPRFSVQATGQPLWEAIRGWNRAPATLSLQHNNNAPSKWEIEGGEMEAGRAIQAGPFEILATGASISHISRLGFGVPQAPPQAQHTLSIPLSMRVDPRLQDAFTALIVQVESAVDDKGRALKPGESVVAPPWRDYEGSIQMPLELPAPAPGATRLKSVRGLLRIATAFRRESWTIDLKATPRAEKKWRQGDEEIRYIFDGLKAEEYQWMAQFHVVRTFAGPRHVFKTNAPWSQSLLGEHEELMHSVHFLDGAGQRMGGGGGGSNSAIEANSIKAEFSIAVPRPRKAPDYDNAPTKLVVEVPLEWREVHFPFEFKDLPLPAP